VKSLLGSDLDNEDDVQNLADAYKLCWGEMEARLAATEDTDGQREIEFQKNRVFMYGLIQKLIESRRERGKVDDVATTQESENFLDFLLNETGYSNEQITADVITYMIGGFHTTANFLTWALFFITKFPQIQDEIYNEIVKLIGSNEEIDFESVGKFNYLSMVLNEVLRYIVVAPYAARYSDSDQIIGGFLIPKKVALVHALGVVLHHPHEWESPEEFNPSHFAPDTTGRHPLAFSPFGVGNRMCPAARYAMIESKLVISKLIQKFKFEGMSDLDPKPIWGLVVTPQEKILLKVHIR